MGKQNIRLATWNMGFWTNRNKHDNAWHWLLDDLKIDIALCQECVPPDWVKTGHTVIWERAYPTGKQTWGTALVTNLPAKPSQISEVDSWLASIPKQVPGKEGLAFAHKAEGWISVAEIELPAIGPTLVVSIHNPFEPIEASRLDGKDISRMRLKKNKDLWLLDVLFYFLRMRLGTRIIVGGDFNYSRLLDKLYGDTGNNEFFDRINDEGFVSLHRKFHTEDEQTYFKKGGLGHQLDYLFSDAPVAEYATACRVVPYSEVEGMSDHAPLVAVLDFKTS
jgi:exonuclease III